MIKLVNLNKRYKEKVILDNVNLDIREGEIIGLLAPNGEGKSTFLKILGGQIIFDSGQYYFNDEVFSYKDKNNIGYMSDSPIMPDDWSISDCVEYYTDNFKLFNKSKCLNILQKFNLDLKNKVKILSKGQSEKLHLALALSVDAMIYIMDEPLASIDLIAREEIIKMILENFNSDSTIIISSHLVSELEGMLDRIILLKNGNIVCNNLVEDIRMSGKSVVNLYKEVYGNEGN